MPKIINEKKDAFWFYNIVALKQWWMCTFAIMALTAKLCSTEPCIARFEAKGTRMKQKTPIGSSITHVKIEVPMEVQ